MTQTEIIESTISKQHAKDQNLVNRKILSICFNQDGSNVVIGHETGFCVLDSKSMELLVDRVLGKAVGIVQVAENSNIFALRGGGLDPVCKANEILVWDEKLEKTVANLKFKSRVIGIEMTKHL
jgi:hypothetical protein